MKTTPRSRLLLIELICDLIIFALCAAACVALLVQARSMSQESTELTQAVYIAQDAAERYRAGSALYKLYWADGTPVIGVTGDTQPDYMVYIDPSNGLEAEVSVYRYQPEYLSVMPRLVYALTVAKEVAP